MPELAGRAAEIRRVYRLPPIRASAKFALCYWMPAHLFKLLTKTVTRLFITQHMGTVSFSGTFPPIEVKVNLMNQCF